MRRIGAHHDHKAPSLAIVDGQQRLTSLYAVIKGKEVIRSNFAKDRIRIAFNPLQSRFMLLTRRLKAGLIFRTFP